MDLIYNAGHLISGDDRITVPATVTVPANGSTTLTVTVRAGLTSGNVVQGWIRLHSEDNNNLHFAYMALVGSE